MQAIIEFTLLFNLKFREIAANFFFSISTIPKPLIPGVSIILASKTSHTFLQSSGVLPLLCLPQKLFCFKCKEGSMAFTNVDFPTPECPENILTLPIISSFNLSIPFISVEETRKH
jgi:hypothetical protein